LKFGKKLLFDTPLVNELGITTKDYEFEFYSTIKKVFISGNYKLSILSDKNRKKSTGLNIGYKPNNSPLIFKISLSQDNMDRDFDISKVDTKNINPTLIQPWEVYYAPDNVKQYNFSMNYSGKFKILTYNLELGNGIQKQPTIDKALTSYLALNLSIPTPLGILSYDFYGMKSEVDPLSNQLTKQKYMGRESTIRLNWDF
jgi:hypothetical protein